MQLMLKIATGILLFFVVGSARGCGFQITDDPDESGRPIELGILYPSNTSAIPTTLGMLLKLLLSRASLKGDHLPLVIAWFCGGGEIAVKESRCKTI